MENDPTGADGRLVQILLEAESDRRAGRLEAALEAYERVREVDPACLPAQVGAAQVLLAQERPNEATIALQAALRLAPKEADLWVLLAHARELLDDARGTADAYRRALALDPARPDLDVPLAQALEALHRPAEAARHYEAALAQPLPDLAALRRLTRLWLRSVPRWHFPMLRDEARNAAYDRAIRQVVRPGALVLDIGTGSGLLAMMAARAGAEHVYTCETVEPLVEVARQIVADNGLADRITVLHKRSNQLEIGIDLPRRADVLISELVDAGLLGEDVVPTVADAREHLLVPEPAMVPESATVMAVLVESAALAELERVERAAGFDVGAFNRLAVPGYLPRRLASYEHRRLSEPVAALAFDFRREIPPVAVTLDIPVAATGTCQAVAFWFRLRLAPDVTLENSPELAGAHWVQAVQLLPERPLRAGQVTSLQVRHDGRHIAFGWTSSATRGDAQRRPA